MTDSAVELARALGRFVAGLQGLLTASWSGDRREPAERPAAEVLADALRIWEPGPVTLPDPPQPFVWLPVGSGRGRFGRRRAPATGVWFVAGTLPGPAAAQVLLVRPNETVIALSRRVPAESIATVVRQLQAAVPGGSRAGADTRFPTRGNRQPFVTRDDYHRPRPAWELTPSGLRPVASSQPALVDTSTATVLTVPGPSVADVVLHEWLAFLSAEQNQAVPPQPATVLAERLAEAWAWAAADALFDQLGEIAAQLAQDPTTGDLVAERHATASAEWGHARDSVLSPIREHLVNPDAVLPDDPRKTLWRRLGIRRAVLEEQDTVLFDADGRLLRVELLPAWAPQGEPPTQVRAADDRTVIEVNVAADTTEIWSTIWSDVLHGIANARLTVPAVSTDLLHQSVPRARNAALTRLVGLRHRLDRAAAFTAWLQALRLGPPSW
ncbi:hypothetical protein ACTOB_002227 [Actinoplanes oblitus]|uniref:Uncharacterized protein n=1 Tax=Actinoplanes oblitus TaxID=3040509 RepID=A0ABY8WPY5_9ACTN|nr:hypothetical protein [Actinoplanes oblitus]WIM98623.1 hypothetical protein ACTOB_002227 [Actinoplanes oblitus]